MGGSTLKRSLRAAEMCDLIEHRSMRLQGKARVCEKWALGQSRNGKYLAFSDLCGLVLRPGRATCSLSSIAALSEPGHSGTPIVIHSNSRPLLEGGPEQAHGQGRDGSPTRSDAAVGAGGVPAFAVRQEQDDVMFVFSVWNRERHT